MGQLYRAGQEPSTFSLWNGEMKNSVEQSEPE